MSSEDLLQLYGIESFTRQQVNPGLRVGHDRHERLVQFVRQDARERADGRDARHVRELVALGQQRRFRLIPLADHRRQEHERQAEQNPEQLQRQDLLRGARVDERAERLRRAEHREGGHQEQRRADAERPEPHGGPHERRNDPEQERRQMREFGAGVEHDQRHAQQPHHHDARFVRLADGQLAEPAKVLLRPEEYRGRHQQQGRRVGEGRAPEDGERFERRFETQHRAHERRRRARDDGRKHERGADEHQHLPAARQTQRKTGEVAQQLDGCDDEREVRRHLPRQSPCRHRRAHRDHVGRRGDHQDHPPALFRREEHRGEEHAVGRPHDADLRALEAEGETQQGSTVVRRREQQKPQGDEGEALHRGRGEESRSQVAAHQRRRTRVRARSPVVQSARRRTAGRPA